MKKFLAVLGIIAGTSLVATNLMAAISDTVLVRVTPVGTKDVTINTVEVDFGSLGISSSAVASTGIDIENTGNIAQSYQLNLDLTGGTGTPWTAATAPGADQFALYAMFNGATAPASASFDATGGANGDHVLVAPRNSTAAIYSGAETGINVSPIAANDNRMLWLRLDMPTSSTSTNLEEQFNVVVTAF